MWEIDLTGSTALVTGASRGIGRAIAIALARAGADVVGVARSEGPLAELSDEIGELGRSYLPLTGDLAHGADIPGLAEDAWSWKGRVDILVNAAGMVIRRDPPDVSVEDFDLMMAVNVRAPFLMSQEIGWRMRQAGGGSIINIASIAGEEVTRAPLHYQAGKAALIQMTRGFASRLGPKIRVNAVGPGYIRTTLNAEWLSDAGNERYVEERTASRRVGTPDDVVGAVVFLASPAASYINGQHLRVDGGWGI
jgi:NAD(P)-dependent dehydrogenase (short-subunit alcohol dehydrogenase family)